MNLTMKYLRMLIVVIAVADILVFSKASGLILLTMGVGATTIFMGILFAYRPASAIGAIIVAIGAASSIEIPTLTEVSPLLTAIFGLLIPIFILVPVATSIEQGELRGSILKRKPAIASALYLLGCIFSVPVTVFLLSLFSPELSTRSSTMAESAILLLIAITGAVIVAGMNPKSITTLAEEETPGKARGKGLSG